MPQQTQTIATQSATAELLVFLGEDCGPSAMLTPSLARVEAEYQRYLNVRRIDIRDAGDAANTFQITATPTLCLCRDGELLASHHGTMLPAHLGRWIRQQLSLD